MVGGKLLHFVGSVCLLLPDDGQGVSLSVEDPVLERQVVVVGEQQVQIPEERTQAEGLLVLFLAKGPFPGSNQLQIYCRSFSLGLVSCSRMFKSISPGTVWLCDCKPFYSI